MCGASSPACSTSPSTGSGSIKPRIGGGFGVKQEVLIEDVPALVTMRTGRPVRARSTTAPRSSCLHAPGTRCGCGSNSGAKPDGLLHAIEMEVVVEHRGVRHPQPHRAVQRRLARRSPSTTRHPTSGSAARPYYTNLPVGGAYRGYGATQGYFALETAIDVSPPISGIDPVELRRRNHIRTGETSPIFQALGEGREGVEQTITSCELGGVHHESGQTTSTGRRNAGSGAARRIGSTASACRSTCRGRASR